LRGRHIEFPDAPNLRWKTVPTERDFPRRPLFKRESHLSGRQTETRVRRRMAAVAAPALAAPFEI
jgi:hypothetical protein